MKPVHRPILPRRHIPTATRGIISFATRIAAAVTVLAAISVALAPPLPAEAVPSAEAYLSTAADLGDGGIDPLGNGATAGARLSLDSSRGDALKGSARVSADSSIGLTLDRAYLKARFPFRDGAGAFRLTLGKSPLSWGKGFVFNAGDPIFGAVPRVTSLTDDEYRTQTAWMAVAYLPFGGFSFVEAVALPRVTGSASTGGTSIGDVDGYGTQGDIARAIAGSENRENRAGCRAVVAPGWGLLQSLETGLLASDGETARAYLALDGSLWVDWYCALSGAWDARGGCAAVDGIAVSSGIFRILGFIPDHPIAARIEALAYPMENRQLFYPSVAVTLADGLTLLAQGIVASGSRVSEIARDGETAPAEALGAIPWLDSGGAILSLGFAWTLLNDIALSGAAAWRFEKGDPIPALGIQAGFACELR